MKQLLRSHSPLALFSLAMVALMCVLPFMVPIHRNPLTTFYGEWLAAALGLAASLLLLRPKSWQPFQFPLVALVPLGLIVVLGIQVWAGLAVYWQHHFLVGLYLLWATLLVVLGAELRREFGLEKLVPLLAWALLAGALLATVITMLQLLGWSHPWLVAVHLPGVGYSANLGQVNHAASYLGLGLVALLYLAGTRRQSGWLTVGSALLLLAGLALTGQRMGWVYVVMLAFGAWFAGRKSSDTAWRALWLIPGFIAMQLVIPPLVEWLSSVMAVLVQWLASIMGGAAGLSAVPPMPAQRVVASMQGGSIRLELLQQAWHVFVSHPWLGAGWGQFGWQDFQLAEQFSNHTGRFTHAHNLLLQLMAETGLAGILVFMAGILAWTTGVFRALSTPAHWCLLGIFAVLALHSLLELPLWYAYFLGVGALVLGMLETRHFEARMDLGPLLLAGFALFGALSLVNLAQHYPRLERWFDISSRKAIAQVIDQVPEMRKRSLLAPYLDFMLLRVMPDGPEFQAYKLATSTRLIRFQPDGKDVYAHATLLAKAGRAGDAKQQLRRALMRHPHLANPYAVKLLRAGDPSTLPLVQMALAFDLARNPVKGLRIPKR